MKGKIWRKILSVCLVLLMVAALVPAQLFSAGAASGIAYIYRWWDSASQKVKSETRYAEATKLQDYSSDLQDLYSGWYYSQNSIEFNKRVNIHGTVNIIICSASNGGSYVKFADGIHVGPGNTLNIYGQGDDTQALEAFADTNDYAGIGGNGSEDCGTINIYGGAVNAKADVDAAGIGGGFKGYGGHINIYGGKINTTGGSVNTNGGAGIGGGGQGWGGYINIYGGDVTAHGGANAAGIGGGDEGTSGDVVIFGGTIHTYGGSANSDGGAGIGGGNEKGVNNIVIYGGDITAQGGCDAAGIGGGDNGEGGNITIHRGTDVEATGGKYGAGIGGGQGKGGGTIKIHGGIVTATAGDYGAGIGGGENGSGGDITIDGGIVRATGGDNGAGIGGGDNGSAGTIRINADITAIGGEYGAGIGGGNCGCGGTITISGGSIESDGGHCGAAIGGGNAGVCESITITNGSFNLKGGISGAGIGSGNGKNCININISGGTFHNVLGGVQAAGIGGGARGTGGKITITGGTFLSVKGGEKGAGIGGGIGDKGGEITISDARIIVDGGKYAAGIGGGYRGESGNIVINSGTIDVTGGANGGAGIGAGIFHPDANYWDTNITINGGTINAYGSKGYEDELPGAAIGSGGRDTDSDQPSGGFTGTINLNGGIIKAFASSHVDNDEEDDNALTAIGLWHKIGYAVGTVHFGGADVTMSSSMDSLGQYCQVVKAGKITFDDDRLVKYMSYDTNEPIKAKHDDRNNVLQGRQYSSVYVETCTHEDCQYTDKGDNHSLACPYCAKNAAENHKYSESDLNWNWAEDHLSATVTFTCEKCGHNKTVDATITKTVDDAGMATYTAAAQFDGKSYTDSVIDYADDFGVRVIGHSISLEGDIGVNFYMELSDAVVSSETAYVHFTIPKNGEPDTQDIKVSDAGEVKSGDKTYYVFKCQVAAKEMTSDIKARIIDGEKQGTVFTYSVKDYADYLLTHTDEREDLAKAAPLVKALLNYGAYTQIYFDKNPGKLANVGLTEEEKALGEVSITVADYDVSGLPAGVTFAGATLSLKSETTLSLYFKSASTLTFSCDGYTVETVKNGEYQVARIRGIKAAHIGDRLPLKVNGNKAVTYSPLNYCKKALDDNAFSDNLKNAIKAFYLYYNAADEYFNVINLSTVTGNIVVKNSGIITGTLSGNHKISIADGATVRLRNADITSLDNSDSARYAGITLLGDATIILEGTNTVRGGYIYHPGIFVPEGKTLTIDGTGLLDASSNGYGCGIGGCGVDFEMKCGNITINGGTITATGGNGAAGIGCGRSKQTNTSCGDITINGGTVTAIGGEYAAGIGCGYDGNCGNITINNTVTQVTAISGGDQYYAIGIGSYGSCGTVTIGGVIRVIRQPSYTYLPE